VVSRDLPRQIGNEYWRGLFLELNMSDNEFSVYQFFQDDKYEKVREFVSVEEAVRAAKHYTDNVAAKIGITKRVIITDGGDSICFEWIQGKGITFGGPQESTNDV
jgi:hypothetical protein